MMIFLLTTIIPNVSRKKLDGRIAFKKKDMKIFLLTAIIPHVSRKILDSYEKCKL